MFRFCVDANHEYSLLYNDMYVLESFHAAASFQLILSPLGEEMDIFSHWNTSQRYIVRTRIIRIILSTNLADHFNFIKSFNENVSPTSEITEQYKFDFLLMFFYYLEIMLCNLLLNVLM